MKINKNLEHITRGNFDPATILNAIHGNPEALYSIYSDEESQTTLVMRLLEEACHAYHILKLAHNRMALMVKTAVEAEGYQITKKV